MYGVAVIQSLESRTLLAVTPDALLTLGATGDDAVIDVAADVAGGFVVAGRFGGAIDLDPGPNRVVKKSRGAPGAYVARYGPGGQFQWVIPCPSGVVPADVEVDGAGDVYLAARFTGVIDADPGKGRLMLNGWGRGTILVARYTPQGRLRWARDFNSYGDASPAGLAIGPAGEVVVVGRFSQTLTLTPQPGRTWLRSLGGYDVFILKFTAAGALDWAGEQGGGFHDLAAGVAIDPVDGTIYVAGTFRGGAELRPGGHHYWVVAPADPAWSVEGAYVSALSTDKSFLWGRAYATADQSQWATDLALGAGGNVYVLGETGEAGTGGTGGPTGGTTASWLWGLDRGGGTLFRHSRRAGGARDAALAASPDGRLYSAGSFAGTVDFYPGRPRVRLTGEGSSDAYVAEYDSLGRPVDVWQIGGAGNQTAAAIAARTGGQFVIAGLYGGPTDFDPGPDVLLRTTPDGEERVWVLQLAP